ncbi:MAG: DUF1499 domain-containing protein [Acidobacteriota bacterium]|nr:MAG: DUF1499 domain-containing protein [Acidobacteriota bacterium]
MKTALWAGLVLIVIVLLLVALQIDDWSRDLTTNTAETDARASDPRLRPRESSHESAELSRIIRQAVEKLPGWSFRAELVDRRRRTLQYVRKTRWLGFEDDVTVRIIDLGDRRRVHVASASRVGRGDLGQNPRNIAELMTALTVELDQAP